MISTDITSLDLFSDNIDISEWGDCLPSQERLLK